MAVNCKYTRTWFEVDNNSKILWATKAKKFLATLMHKNKRRLVLGCGERVEWSGMDWSGAEKFSKKMRVDGSRVWQLTVACDSLCCLLNDNIE